MGSMAAVKDARISACNAFGMEANTNPCPEQSAVWGFYVVGHAALTNDDLVEVVQ